MTLTRTLIIAAFMACMAPAQGAVHGHAVSITDSINSSGTIAVHQPAELTRLLMGSGQVQTQAADDRAADASAEGHKGAVSRTGYRVQVFDDNNPRVARRNAEAYHARMQAEFPHFRSYLTFNSPYWRVRVGDFHTRAEAEAAMAEIRQAFPSLGAYLRVIRDRINTTN